MKLPEINLTDVITLIIQEIASRCEAFSHVDARRVLVCMATNRSNASGGTFGKLVPLRFKDGAETLRYRGKLYAMPRLRNGGVDQRYLIYFYHPRFFNLSPIEKLKVIFHELYHISPYFNGDIRRLASHKASHGNSRERFDDYFENDLRKFHAYIVKTPYMKFLGMNARALRLSFEKIKGRRMKMPRPVVVG
ncbi:MAG TPA: putative metallopeptidase [Spirochaetota bacterium]|nr:putative metallopeptidase [Spirochaetota bacterium]